MRQFSMTGRFVAAAATLALLAMPLAANAQSGAKPTAKPGVATKSKTTTSNTMKGKKPKTMSGTRAIPKPGQTPAPGMPSLPPTSAGGG